MGRVGVVYQAERFVGTITESFDGYRFVYDPMWQRTGFPMGYNFPLSQREYYCKELFPFFENLLSEGWLREIQVRTQKIDTRDSFGLLLANGEDVAGAFSIRPQKVISGNATNSKCF